MRQRALEGLEGAFRILGQGEMVNRSGALRATRKWLGAATPAHRLSYSHISQEWRAFSRRRDLCGIRAAASKALSPHPSLWLRPLPSLRDTFPTAEGLGEGWVWVCQLCLGDVAHRRGERTLSPSLHPHPNPSPQGGGALRKRLFTGKRSRAALGQGPRLSSRRR